VGIPLAFLAGLSAAFSNVSDRAAERPAEDPAYQRKAVRHRAWLDFGRADLAAKARAVCARDGLAVLATSSPYAELDVRVTCGDPDTRRARTTRTLAFPAFS
jgi:hypothetical protein